MNENGPKNLFSKKVQDVVLDAHFVRPKLKVKTKTVFLSLSSFCFLMVKIEEILNNLQSRLPSKRSINYLQLICFFLLSDK